MLGVAIELRTQCARCGQALPINACAPTFVCGACGHPNAIDDARWTSLVEDVIPEVVDMTEGEGKNRTIMTGGATYTMVIGHQKPRCSACKTTLPEEAYGFVDRGWTICVGCGARMSLRRPPPILAAQGAQLLVGEDSAQLAGAGGAAALATPKAAQTIVFYCANCKAPLSVDGSNRMVKCQYCAADVYLPDDLWQRLHPVAVVARWYMCMSQANLEQARKASWKWGSLRDAVIDANRNIYCIGESDESFRDHPSVWCMTPDLQVHWYKDLAEGKDDDAGLALDPFNGRLLFWNKNRHSATVLSAQDGSPTGKLGGKQPSDATTHTFDLDDCRWLRVDVDGTLLALLYKRLVRFSPDGQPLPTWPPKTGLFAKKERLRPIYQGNHDRIDVDDKDVEEIGSQPVEIDDYTNSIIGWDGKLYLEYREWVACFDRAGERLYRIKLPIDDMRGDSLGVDGAGNLYVPGRVPGDPQPRVLVRVSPDGRRIDQIATDHKVGGVLGDEDRILVAPDGTIVFLAYGQCARVLGPDGRLLWISDKAKEDDADELRRDREKD